MNMMLLISRRVFSGANCNQGCNKRIAFFINQNAAGLRRFSVSTQRNAGNLRLSHTIYQPSTKNDALLPLFITHGLMGSKQNWASIAKAIVRSTNRQVVTFDARNHGDSPHDDEMNYYVMLEDVKNLAEELGSFKFSLLGHSMGGLAAMCFGLRYPQYLEKLVIVDIAPTVLGDFSGNEGYIRTLVSMDLNSMKGLTLSSARKSIDSALQASIPDNAVRAFLLTNLAQAQDGSIYWKPNLPILLKNIEKIREFPQKIKTRQHISHPAIFIRGGNSNYVPDKAIPEIKAMFPLAEIATIEGSGHWPHADNPTEFLNILIPFLQRT